MYDAHQSSSSRISFISHRCLAPVARLRRLGQRQEVPLYICVISDGALDSVVIQMYALDHSGRHCRLSTAADTEVSPIFVSLASLCFFIFDHRVFS